MGLDGNYSLKYWLHVRQSAQKGVSMRLDRFLCEMNIGTRSQVKAALRQGLVTVNGQAARDPGLKIDEQNDCVCFQGQALRYQKFVYYMLNKPAGVVSATRDNTADTVVSLLGKDVLKDIFPVGRLDKDTTGLLLLTNDGELAHRLLSPRKHVDKVYCVTTEHPLSEEEKNRLEQGVDIGEDPRRQGDLQKDKKNITLPARVETVSDREILLTIREGRFHQVKRMLQAVGNGVLSLERVGFGGLDLDGSLRPGEYRELTKQEVDSLYET